MERYSAYHLVIAMLVLAAFIWSGASIAKEKSPEEADLEQGIWLYTHENYEEALALFKKLREKNPQSPMVAYYLGITYKQLQDFTNAKPNLEAALTLEPRVMNALPELIGILYQSDQIEEAKKWLDVAQREGMNPAQTAFFKGLVLLREGKNPEEAKRSFEEAGKLDDSLAETTKYFEAFCYLQSKKLSEAKDVFQELIRRQPTSDLAYFANEYVEAISKKEEAEKPFRASVGYAWQYDTNVILAPDDAALTAGISNKGDWRQATTFDSEYRFKYEDKLSVTPGYSFYWAKQSDLGFYDMISHDISLQSACNFKDASVAFPVHFNHVTVNDKAYLGLVGIGNVNNVAIGRNQMIQSTFQYNRKTYMWPVGVPDDNRDSNEALLSLAWFYFFGKNQEAFANMRYAFNNDYTKGSNWIYSGNRLSLTSSVPLTKMVRLTTAMDYFIQDYWKTNSVYNKDRFDNILTLSSLLAIKVVKDVELQLQYVFVDNASSIGIFKYKRQVYNVGMKYSF